MGAVSMWARADLRARWRSWVVLGLLAGVTFGIAAAGVAGARRTDRALPRFEAATSPLDAAVLPNDPSFDAPTRARIAALPEVSAAAPFMVPFALEFAKPKGVDGQLVPVNATATRTMATVVLQGRLPNSSRADEIVIDQNIRKKFGLGIGDTMVMRQRVPPDAYGALTQEFSPANPDVNFTAKLRVVGITKAVGTDESATTSPAFYRKYADRLLGPVNMFVALRHGENDFPKFQSDVQRIVGHPVNVERGSDLLGLRQVRNITDIERNGLLLFSLVALLGGAVLVGQALVRAVTAGAADATTWRALGADRPTMVGGMVLPALVVGCAGALTTLVVAVALSPRFPLATTRRYELDIGYHADWSVLLLAAAVLVVASLLTAFVTAWLRTGRARDQREKPSTVGDWAARAGLSPALVTGARLAVEPGRGRRAVPVRSALVGAIAGVVGVVGCLTFRAGITDALSEPRRSGIVWESTLVSVSGPIDDGALGKIAANRDAAQLTHATWVRALPINGVGTPTFGIAQLKGAMHLVVLSGRAPRRAGEIAFAPSTLRALHLRVGDRVTLGNDGSRVARVVGTALLPATSHTEYDQSGWMTLGAVNRFLQDDPPSGPEDIWDFALVRWRPGTQKSGDHLLKTLGTDTTFAVPPTLPGAVIELGHMRSLPFVLAVFFALLAIATVAHALVTTVRRRRHDLAIMRSFGFTARQSRVAIAWQATLLAVAGVVVGVPLGIVAGRAMWRSLADNFPIAYVPPLAAVVVIVVVPAAILVVNALAAGPGRAAARIRPAEALRVE